MYLLLHFTEQSTLMACKSMALILRRAIYTELNVDPLQITTLLKQHSYHNLLPPTFGALSVLSLGRRLWLNFGLSNMRAKGLADVVKGLGAKRLKLDTAGAAVFGCCSLVPLTGDFSGKLLWGRKLVWTVSSRAGSLAAEEAHGWNNSMCHRGCKECV